MKRVVRFSWHMASGPHLRLGFCWANVRLVWSLDRLSKSAFVAAQWPEFQIFVQKRWGLSSFQMMPIATSLINQFHFNHCTEVRFASFFSGGFTTMAGNLRNAPLCTVVLRLFITWIYDILRITEPIWHCWHCHILGSFIPGPLFSDNLCGWIPGNCAVWDGTRNVCITQDHLCYETLDQGTTWTYSQIQKGMLPHPSLKVSAKRNKQSFLSLS